MRNFFLALGLIFFCSLIHASAPAPAVSRPPVYNPYIGNFDFVGPGNGLTPGTSYYLYYTSSQNAYYTFDGTNFCLFVNDVSKVCYSNTPNQFLLLEDNTFLLQEDGTKLVLQ